MLQIRDGLRNARKKKDGKMELQAQSVGSSAAPSVKTATVAG